MSLMTRLAAGHLPEYVPQPCLGPRWRGGHPAGGVEQRPVHRLEARTGILQRRDRDDVSGSDRPEMGVDVLTDTTETVVQIGASGTEADSARTNLEPLAVEFEFRVIGIQVQAPEV